MFADPVHHACTLGDAVKLRFLLGCAMILGCGSTASAQGAQGTLPMTDVRNFYAAYETALRTHRRDSLATFYHPAGALIVLNGVRMELTNAQISANYRGAWNGPAFFSFDSLRFHPLTSAQVVVTGGFTWLPPQSTDTARYIYMAVVDRTGNGPKIRVEHETERRRPQR